jgi:hypothetical protein
MATTEVSVERSETVELFSWVDAISRVVLDLVKPGGVWFSVLQAHGQAHLYPKLVDGPQGIAGWGMSLVNEAWPVTAEDQNRMLEEYPDFNDASTKARRLEHDLMRALFPTTGKVGAP